MLQFSHCVVMFLFGGTANHAQTPWNTSAQLARGCHLPTTYCECFQEKTMGWARGGEDSILFYLWTRQCVSDSTACAQGAMAEGGTRHLGIIRMPCWGPLLDQLYKVYWKSMLLSIYKKLANLRTVELRGRWQREGVTACVSVLLFSSGFASFLDVELTRGRMWSFQTCSKKLERCFTLQTSTVRGYSIKDFGTSKYHINSGGPFLL